MNPWLIVRFIGCMVITFVFWNIMQHLLGLLLGLGCAMIFLP